MLLGRGIGQHDEAPGLAVVRGRGEGRRVENVPYNGIRHTVRFEAADRAARPQKGVEIRRGRQSGWVEF